MCGVDGSSEARVWAGLAVKRSDETREQKSETATYSAGQNGKHRGANGNSRDAHAPGR